MFFQRARRRHNYGRRAIIDARSVTGGYRPTFPKWRLQFGEVRECGVRPRMFVRIHRNRLSIGIFGVHTYDFLGEKPRLRRAASSLLAAQRKSVLVLARDLKLL